MIIWVNGAFGSGKTQTSFELNRRIPNSFVFDPENFGYFLNKNIPKEIKKDDFQDYPIWRESNYKILKYIDSEYDGTIIVPMTIVDPIYFEETVGRLQNNGVTLHHFVLWASKDMLKKRLRSRGERKNSWPEQQIDRCMKGLSNDIFEKRIDTEALSIEDVVETIASSLNIKLIPDNRNKFRKSWDRIKTQLSHIRI